MSADAEAYEQSNKKTDGHIVAAPYTEVASLAPPWRDGMVMLSKNHLVIAINSTIGNLIAPIKNFIK